MVAEEISRKLGVYCVQVPESQTVLAGAEPAGQTLCQLESRKDVNPLVSEYSCLKEIQRII